MARPKKLSIDYFPHDTKHGKTMFIIESKYGNAGYAFWFKILELLGASEGHYYQCKSTEDIEFLTAKTRLSWVECQKILETLANMGAIDADLWKKRQIIWSDNFIERIKDVYRKRIDEIPEKPTLKIFSNGRNGVSDSENGVSGIGSTQTKLKETKLKETKLKKTKEKKTEEKIEYAEFVSMTKAEYRKLVAEYGRDNTKKMIDVLDNYKGSKGKTYKSDYRAILSWVVEKINAVPRQKLKVRAEARMIECSGCGTVWSTGEYEACPVCTGRAKRRTPSEPQKIGGDIKEALKK